MGLLLTAGAAPGGAELVDGRFFGRGSSEERGDDDRRGRVEEEEEEEEALFLALNDEPSSRPARCFVGADVLRMRRSLECGEEEREEEGRSEGPLVVGRDILVVDCKIQN